MSGTSVSSTPKLCVCWRIDLPDGVADLLDAAVHIGANNYSTSVRYGGMPGAAPGWTVVISKAGQPDQTGVAGQYVICDCSSGIAEIVDAATFAAEYGPGPASSPLPSANLTAVNAAVSGLQEMSS
jgi:hypothetical protein